MSKIRIFTIIAASLMVIIVVLFVAINSFNSMSNGAEDDDQQEGQQIISEGQQKDETTKIPTSPAGKITAKPEDAGHFYELEVTRSDIVVIPDRHNTGAQYNQTMWKVTAEDIATLKEKYGLPFKMSSETLMVINFYSNPTLPESITIENVDFSEVSFAVYHAAACTRRVKLIFKNCVFKGFGMNDMNELVSFSFLNCSFTSISGSYMELRNCYVGGNQSDGIRAFKDVDVINCYIADKSQPFGTEKVNNHTDGVQIYGTKGGECGNIHFENCRFELPRLCNSTAYVNACIMLQIEFSDADDITFTNCRLNGGGYSIYAWSKKEQYSLTNAKLINIEIGCLHSWGNIYSRVGQDVEFVNVIDAQDAYVSSVWTENGSTHIIASNDTNDFKTILVCTDKGTKLISLDSCPTSAEITEEMAFVDFPFDREFILDYEAKWVVCYDVSSSKKTLIRLYNPQNVRLGEKDDGNVYEIKG